MSKPPALNADTRGELLRLARATIEHHLTGKGVPDFIPQNPELQAHCGAFVSLHRGKALRGCIGQIVSDRPLYEVVGDCAISAATGDSRFKPVEIGELPRLTIEISVLTPLRRIHAPEEIEVGRHGIFITQDYRRGLLLPQVASQNHWDRRIFLDQTCVKAGLPKSAWMDKRTIIEIFEAQVFSEEHLEQA